MTVKGLREALSGLPDDLPVLDEYDGTWAPTGVYRVTLYRESGYIEQRPSSLGSAFTAVVVTRHAGEEYSPVDDDFHVVGTT